MKLRPAYRAYFNFVNVVRFLQVLDMEVLPAPKFPPRQWRYGRKRRRSGAEGVESEGMFELI